MLCWFKLIFQTTYLQFSFKIFEGLGLLVRKVTFSQVRFHVKKRYLIRSLEVPSAYNCIHRIDAEYTWKDVQYFTPKMASWKRLIQIILLSFVFFKSHSKYSIIYFILSREHVILKLAVRILKCKRTDTKAPAVDRQLPHAEEF